MTTTIPLTAPQQKIPIPSAIFEGGNSEFRQLYNRHSFQFSHRLCGHPLFELPRLATLAETLGPGNVAQFGNDAKVNMKWTEMPSKKDHRDKVARAIADLEKSGSWLLIYRTQLDPEYRVLMDQIIAEIGEKAGVPLEKEITWRDAYVFLASPFAVTPYHIDHESTFLFQIHGQREANIWDREDRSVLTDLELESYYCGNLSAANYKESNQSKASIYSMVAGTGVHHPVLAPHAFKNGSTYSIALGVHYCLRDWDRRARIYQFNHCLRQFRLNPVPPGRSSWRDQAKIRTLGLISSRNPKTKYDLIRSGIKRLTFPFRAAGAVKKRITK
jgi:hypothetical protein